MNTLLKRSFSLDLRALALMRIALGLTILLDLSIRISDLEAFYANSGVAPIEMIIQHNWNPFFFSFHIMNGLWQFQFLLFMVAAYCALMMLIGYRTRLFTFLSWLLLLSLHNRNPLILQGGDDLLRMLLFWGIFLPWNGRYSVDHLRSSKREEDQYFGLAGVAYILQICYVYTFSALLKGPEWHTNFTALYYVYNLDQIAYPTAQYLSNYPELLKGMTACAYYLELWSPLLLILPVKTPVFRILGLVAIIGFHLMNGVTLLVGLFFVIGIAGCVGLFPPVIMEWLENRFGALKRHATASFLALSGIGLPGARIDLREAGPLWLQQTRQMVLAMLIVYVFSWNLCNCRFFRYKIGEELSWVAYVLRLDQNWGMFSPGVFKDDGWYVLEGVTDADKEGMHIDLAREGDTVSYAKPANIASLFKNDRWRKYSENYILSRYSYMRGYFCNYLRRVWNTKHPEKRIRQLQIIYMMEFTLPDYQYSIPDKRVLFECNP